MRSKRASHSDSNTGSAINKQIRYATGEIDWFIFFICIRQLPIYCIFFNISKHFLTKRRKLTFCVSVSRRTITITATIIAMERDKRISHIPRLTQPNQSAIDRAITVRMESTHGIANRLSTLNKFLVIHITLVKHIPKNTSGNRLQTIFRRRNGSVSNNT